MSGYQRSTLSNNMLADQTAIYNRYKSLCEAAYAADHDSDKSDTWYEMSDLAETMAIDYLKSNGLWDCPEGEDEDDWLSIERSNDPLYIWMKEFNDVMFEDDEEEEEEDDDEDDEDPMDCVMD